MGNVFVGDIGTKLKFDIGIDVSNVTFSKIKYKKPNGDTGEWISYNDVDTYIAYIIQSGDIDVPGSWKLQPYVELNDGWKGYGSIVSIYFEKAL